jgi:hypothetical protein
MLDPNKQQHIIVHTRLGTCLPSKMNDNVSQTGKAKLKKKKKCTRIIITAPNLIQSDRLQPHRAYMHEMY